MYNKELLKGTLQTIILKLLSEHERMYGYEMTQVVKKLTEGKIILTEGALYPSLHKLESVGMIRSEKVKVDNRTRKYYSLTEKGNLKAKIKVEEWMAFIQTMKNVLNPNYSSI